MAQPAKSNPVLPIILLVLLLGGGGVAAYFLAPQLMGGTKEVTSMAMTYEVTRGELLITVTEEGNVESASNIDVKCNVAGGSAILWIVPDGQQVEKGEKIVELDAAALEDSINTQKIAYEKARATKIQSEKAFSVAKISVREYLEGTFKQSLQDASALITISEENLRSAQNSLEHSEKMFRKGYVSSLELEGQKFAVERAKLELGSANTAKEVLEKFTKLKTLEDLESQVVNAEAQMQSDAAAYDLEESRLQRLQDQLANCVLLAPQRGMVVYANERSSRGGQSSVAIEEGAAVRERQTILRLPDLTKMQVKVNVHESKVDQLSLGLRARIRILDRETTGIVETIANQPEPSSFFSGNVKEYASTVRVDPENSDSLRPGMTAEVEILVAHLKDALTLPVAAIVEQRGNFFAWVDKGSTPEKRPLVLGYTNDSFVEVKDGVALGERVLLNPRAVVKEAREAMEEESAVDVSKRFGDAASPDVAAGGPDSSGGPEMGGGRAGRGEGTRGGGPRSGEDGPARGEKAGGGQRRGGGGGMAALDKDGDGKISKDEAPERMQGFFDSLDSNGDGFIDEAEQAALRNRGGGRPGGGGGGDGGGAPGN